MSVTDFQAIYRERAEDYDRLVSAEDEAGNLVREIQAKQPLAGSVVVDVGAGTGRIARLVAPLAKRVIAVEPQAAMLEVARRRVEAAKLKNCELLEGRAQALPVATECADLAVAGWVFGHVRSWSPSNWRVEIGRALDEMSRVVREGGHLIVLETLGTGTEEPAPPNEELAEYYTWLEVTRGFSRRAIRTDYQFASPAEAAEACGFFFGAELADKIRANGWSKVPECTGVWSFQNE